MSGPRTGSDFDDLAFDYREASRPDSAYMQDVKKRLRKAAGKGPSRAKAMREPHTSIAKVESDRSRKNSRTKGNRGELDVAKVFSDWCGEHVRRTPMSGGWSNAKFGVTADLVCAKKAFLFSVEIKHREGWVLDDLITGMRSDHDKSIIQWWLQVSAATPDGKEPLLVFRRNRQPWLVMALAASRVYGAGVAYMTATMWGAPPEHQNVIVMLLDEFLDHEPVPRGLKNHNKRLHLRHGLTESPTYHCWENMVQRCTNPNAKNFSRYGGRGIRICARWWRFDNFLADMGEKPDGFTLDRKENNGDYTPKNCRWATKQEQANNRRTNRRLTSADGRVLTIAEWSRITGLGWKTIEHRIETGWSADQALGLEDRPSWVRKAPS